MNELEDMSKDSLVTEILRADFEIKRQKAELLKAQARLANAGADRIEKGKD